MHTALPFDGTFSFVLVKFSCWEIRITLNGKQHFYSEKAAATEMKPRAHNPISLCLSSSPNIYKHLTGSRSTREQPRACQDQKINFKDNKSILSPCCREGKHTNRAESNHANVQNSLISVFLPTQSMVLRCF